MHRASPASPPAYYDPPGSSTTYHAAILVAVLVSDAIAGLLSPSCYDSIIMIKKLPYLPDILPSSSSAYNIYVEDFMVRDVFYLRLVYVLKLCESSVVPYSAADASAFFWRFLLDEDNHVATHFLIAGILVFTVLYLVLRVYLTMEL